MRIGIVSPLYESVPPKFYGGTERVVSYLTEELVAMGHDVTLFASGDSQTSAKLEPVCAQALRLDPSSMDPLAPHILLLERIFQKAHTFDIIHFNIDHIHFPLFRRSATPHLTTLHGRLDIKDLIQLHREFIEEPLVSISNAQREPLPWAQWAGTVYHGLPQNLYKPYESQGEYLAFLGRISPEKRPDRAIKIAEQAGMKLLIAAKVDKTDREYYEEVIRPLLKSPWAEFIGEIGENEKNEFLGKAYALLFPIDWPEPFGLVMIEAIACGTPVIAWRSGSVPEIISNEVTGFIVDSIEEAVKAIEKIKRLNRANCRQDFESRFTAIRMALDYVRIYQTVIDKKYPLPKAI
jgi:glycosyltransferase involved in cell wall biosynthesis